MKSVISRILAAALCLALLCGCAAQNDAAGNNETADAPGTENNSPDADTQKDSTAETPGESGSDSSGEQEDSPAATLTAEELKEWETYFNTMENNGLLRFPYAGLENDPDQLAPYLVWLFYDIGEPESEFTDEELALLSETDLWLEPDASRLSRDYMNRYLYEHFNIPAEKTENLLDAAKLGVYLLQYDAWYMSHGDTEYSFYEFDRGEIYEDGTVKLYHFKQFLRVAQGNGEMDYIDEEMVVTLVPREDSTWYVASNEILK